MEVWMEVRVELKVGERLPDENSENMNVETGALPRPWAPPPGTPPRACVRHQSGGPACVAGRRISLTAQYEARSASNVA